MVGSRCDRPRKRPTAPRPALTVAGKEVSIPSVTVWGTKHDDVGEISHMASMNNRAQKLLGRCSSTGMSTIVVAKTESDSILLSEPDLYSTSPVSTEPHVWSGRDGGRTSSRRWCGNPWCALAKNSEPTYLSPSQACPSLGLASEVN